jgi:hypothetical protein
LIKTVGIETISKRYIIVLLSEQIGGFFKANLATWQIFFSRNFWINLSFLVQFLSKLLLFF